MYLIDRKYTYYHFFTSTVFITAFENLNMFMKTMTRFFFQNFFIEKSEQKHLF